MKSRIIKLIVLVVLIGASFYGYKVYQKCKANPEIKWTEQDYDFNSYSFPKGFLWGTASAAHQVEGNHFSNNWSDWENKLDENGKSPISHNQKAGLAANHWSMFDTDIDLMKELGLNSYRFSLSWSKIEAKKGAINNGAIQHYHQLIDSLIKEDIVPMITLHHFSHPSWFEKLGAFEKEENIDHFVNFAERMFLEFGDKVPYWCTINEPNVFVTGGYVQGNFPPGKKDPDLAGKVLLNMLKAHIKVYDLLKNLPGGKTAQIGIVKDIFQFHPNNRWDLMDWIVAENVDKAFNESTLQFFRTGDYHFKFYPDIDIKYQDKRAVNSYDFIGLNYYSHIVFDFSFDQEKALEPVMPKDEIKTDMEYTMYPEGFYEAIKRISELGKPIIVTENGVADADDDIREVFIKKYLYALNKAINDGYDVRGYFYWSLTDNFEWAEGYDMKFGLYELDLKTQERRLREGSKVFQSIVKSHN